MSSARSLACVAATSIAAAWWCAPSLFAGPADEPPAILEPGPEQPGAIGQGAADVKKAQALARKKRVPEAVAMLEKLAATLPSATHDCNLALAYLRAGELTRAQLRWDLARLRGVTPPEWCTTTLAADLAAALRDKGYVPLALSIEPASAVVDVAGLRVRKLDLIWVAPGTYAITARADGLVDETVHVAVAAPSARAAIALDPPAPLVMEPPIDAAAPPVDAPPPIDAAVPIDLPPPPPPPAPVQWPTYVGLGVGGAALVAGAVLHARAYGTRTDADALPSGSAAFEAKAAEFSDQRALAIGAYVLSAAGFGFAAGWWLGHRAPEGRPAVGVSVGGGGAALTVTWGTP